MKGNNKHINYEAFKRYRANEMTPAERNAFEKELQKDPFVTEAFEGMEQLPENEFNVHIRELASRVSSPKKGNKFRFIAVAASILILVSIGILWLQIENENPTPKITQTELPPEIQKNNAIITAPEPKRVAPKIEAKELQALEAEVESEEASEAPKLVEMSSKFSPPEEQTTVATIPIPEKSKTEIDQMDVINGTAKGIMTGEKDSQPTKMPKVNSNIRIRGYAKLGSVKPQTTAKIFRGKVISAADKLPLPGVNLVEKGSSNGTISDIDGNFELPLNDSNSTIVVSFIGMENKEILPTENKSTTIELEPNKLAIDEVTVVGFGKQTKESVTGSTTRSETENRYRFEEATPQGGYKELRQYLDKNALLPANFPKKRDVVRIKILLDQQGNIQGFENLNKAPDELYSKAKDLLRNAPGWQPALNNKQPTESFVKLRIVFRKSE